MISIVVEDSVCPFSEEDLERVRAAGYGCEFYGADTEKRVVLSIPLDRCDNDAIKLLRGGAHHNFRRRRDLRG